MPHLALKTSLLALLLLTLLPAALVAADDMGADDPDVLEFALITDTHKWGPTADVRYADTNIRTFIDYCNAHPRLQFALYGGDFMNAYNTNHEQAMFCLEHGRRDFAGLRIPMYVTKGNHDCNGKQWTADGRHDNSQIITDHEFYQFFNPCSPTNPLADSTGVVLDPVKPEGNYYYRDFPKYRFRLIVLNDYDLDSLEYYGYHGEQMKWLAEKGLYFADKEQPTEWSFLILAHGFGYNMFGKPISRLLHAYVNGQDFADEDRGYAYHCQFNKLPRAKLVALIGGHNHEDLYDCPDGYNIIHVNRGFATGGEVGNPDLEVCFDHFYLNMREQTLLEHRIGRGRDHLFRYNPGAQLDPQLPFTDAAGMGNFTQGGLHGRVLWVTNLRDSGEGSLRWALTQKGCRTVCFKVGGAIELRSPIVISDDSLTVCGQTAPGQGITLQGGGLQVTASEVILRFLSLRSCPLTDGDFGQHNLLFDHLSASFTEGAAITVCRARDVTVQNCLISHTQTTGLEAGGYMASYYHNLIVNCPQAIHIPDNEGENRWLHIFRNVIDNWQDHAIYGGGRGGEVTLEDNYFILGPATRNQKVLDVADDGSGRYYTSGNLLRDHEQESRRNTNIINDRAGMPYDPAPGEYDAVLRQKMDPVARPQTGSFASTCSVIAAFHYRGLFSRPTKNEIWREALTTAGNSRHRDTYDAALISSLRNDTALGGTDGIISSASQVGGYPRVPKASHNPQYTDFETWTDTCAQFDKSIVILFENDVHCNIDAYPLVSGYRDALSSDTCHVGLVTTGDYLQGEVISSISNGQYIIDIMKHMGYDAVGIGGHELDRKVADLQTLLSQLGPVVTNCNLRRTKDNTPVFEPYIMRQYGRRRVAFVGALQPNFYNVSHQSLEDDARQTAYHLSGDNFYTTVQRTVDQARQNGADYVVLLGFVGTQAGNDKMVSMRELIRRTHGIDVALDGLTHFAIGQEHVTNALGQDVILTRTSGSLHELGKVIIAPDGLITSEMIDIKELHFRSLRETQMLDSIHSLFAHYSDTIIGHTDIRLISGIEDVQNQGVIDRLVETNQSDLCSDAMRWLTDADVGFINSGALRKELTPGDFTRGAFISLFPFDNKVKTVRITGRQLTQALNVMARKVTANRDALLLPSGMTYTLVVGHEVRDIKVFNKYTGQYEPIDAESFYTLATTDYILADHTYDDAFATVMPIAKPSVVYADAVMRYLDKVLRSSIGMQYATSQNRVLIQ